MPLGEAFQTLALQQEVQALGAVELLEREIWVVTAILATSGPIWRQLPQPTISFPLRSSQGPATCHLEVGIFAHLAALDAPSPDELELIAAAGPCWARVYPHNDRRLAGQSGAMACSYVPIPVAEAVALLGLETILTQLETATRAAGRSLLDNAAVQALRWTQVARAEHTLGWGANPPVEVPAPTLSLCSRLALVLASQERLVLGTAYLALLAILLCLLGVLPELLAALSLGAAGLVIWAYRSSR
jgi:hypothetical protein